MNTRLKKITYLSSDGIRVTVDEQEVTEAEYQTLRRVLSWLRNTPYGTLELTINTFKDRNGSPKRSVDIQESERERVLLD